MSITTTKRPAVTLDRLAQAMEALAWASDDIAEHCSAQPVNLAAGLLGYDLETAAQEVRETARLTPDRLAALRADSDRLILEGEKDSSVPGLVVLLDFLIDAADALSASTKKGRAA